MNSVVPAPFVSTASDGILSREEVETFRRFMVQLNPPPAASSSCFAQSGTSVSTLSVPLSTPSSSKVIDSGASHYMTSMSSLFSTYHVCSRRDKVCIVDGSYSSIASKKDTIASPSIHLSSILHVPKFSLNLLFISDITKTPNYSVTFLPSHYVFQDLETRRG